MYVNRAYTAYCCMTYVIHLIVVMQKLASVNVSYNIYIGVRNERRLVSRLP